MTDPHNPDPQNSGPQNTGPQIAEIHSPELHSPVVHAPVVHAPGVHVYEPQGLKFYLSVLITVLYMTTFVVQAIRIPSESMENTLMVGDFLLADKIHYSANGWFGRHLLPYRAVRRGDIVVFHYPVDPKQFFVKRVIGLPGEHIKLLDKAVLVNGERLPEDYARHVLHDYNPYRDSFPDITFMVPPYLTTDVDRRWRKQLFHYLDHGEIVVPPGNFFVMGDNRDRSLDSRYWGFVPQGNITGRPLVIYLSLNQPDQTGSAAPNDKLIHSGHMLAHILQLARWDRMFRPVY
jgi:signal peptidase I